MDSPGRLLGILADGPPVSDALSALCAEMERSTGAAACACLVDGNVIAAFGSNLPVSLLAGLAGDRGEALPFVQAASSGEAVGWGGEEESVVFTPKGTAILESHGYRGGLCVPVVDSSGRTRAVISLLFGEPRGATASECTILENACAFTKVVLDRAEAKDAFRSREAEWLLERELVASTVQSLPYGIAVVGGSNFEFLFANTAFRSLTPQSPVLGRPLPSVLPGWESFFLPRFRRVFETGEVASGFDEELPVARTGAPERAWFNWSVQRVELSRGRGHGLVFSLRETTTRVRAEQQLRENEERFRLATEAINGVVYDWDVRAGRLHRSAGLLSLIGVRPEDAPDEVDWWKNRMHPDDWPRASDLMNRVLARRAPVFESEYRVRHEDGRWLHVRDKGRVVYDESGAPRRVVGCTEDITERVAARAEVAEIADRFRTLADNIGQLVWIADEHGQPTWCNKRWMEAIGVEPAGFAWENVIPSGAADLVEKLRAAFLAGADWEETLPLRGRDGNIRWFLSRASAIRSPSGSVARWFGTHTDITELRDTHAALGESMRAAEQARLEAERARAAADAANRAKDHFLAALSHELRTPLSPVMMGIDLLGRRSDLPPAAAEVLAMIKRNIKVEARLIDDLLDLNRIVHGKLTFAFQPVDMHQIINRAVDVVRPALVAKNQHLIVEFDAARSGLTGDPERLQQVVWNLLTNASKFTPHDGTITLRTALRSECFSLEVSDTGIGFVPETAERIFEPFEQADRKVTKEYGGLGLGLAISNATVLAHRGTIAAFSKGRGKGATFRVLLPLAAAEA